jgi:hypothetical protein
MKHKQQQAFLQAIRLAADEFNGFKAGEVMMVEAMWRALDAEWSIFGFVVSLVSGRRVYLQIIDDYGDAGHIEEVLVLDMLASERLPSLQGLGAVKWHTDALPELNELLAA